MKIIYTISPSRPRQVNHPDANIKVIIGYCEKNTELLLNLQFKESVITTFEESFGNNNEYYLNAQVDYIVPTIVNKLPHNVNISSSQESKRQ